MKNMSNIHKMIDKEVIVMIDVANNTTMILNKHEEFSMAQVVLSYKKNYFIFYLYLII